MVSACMTTLFIDPKQYLYWIVKCLREHLAFFVIQNIFLSFLIKCEQLILSSDNKG